MHAKTPNYSASLFLLFVFILDKNIDDFAFIIFVFYFVVYL
jgi:hypothetical protein